MDGDIMNKIIFGAVALFFCFTGNAMNIVNFDYTYGCRNSMNELTAMINQEQANRNNNQRNVNRDNNQQNANNDNNQQNVNNANESTRS